VLIPSLYATSPRARSLRLVRVFSDQNTRWRLLFSLYTNKRQEIRVSLIFQYHMRVDAYLSSAANVQRSWLLSWVWSVDSGGFLCIFFNCFFFYFILQYWIDWKLGLIFFFLFVFYMVIRVLWLKSETWLVNLSWSE
jgi:hypothetical protein